MKTANLLFVFLIISFFCNSDKAKKQLAENSTKTNNNPNVICNSIFKKNEFIGFDSVIIKTCTYKNYKSISIGNPSYNGKYYWEYELYQSEQKIENTKLFNSNYQDLEKLINRQLKQEYETNSKNLELKECMEWINFKYYILNEMGISFSENNTIEFIVNYHIGSACDNVGGSIQSFKINEISKYLH